MNLIGVEHYWLCTIVLHAMSPMNMLLMISLYYILIFVIYEFYHDVCYLINKPKLVVTLCPLILHDVGIKTIANGEKNTHGMIKIYKKGEDYGCQWCVIFTDAMSKWKNTHFMGKFSPRPT